MAESSKHNSGGGHDGNDPPAITPISLPPELELENNAVNDLRSADFFHQHFEAALSSARSYINNAYGRDCSLNSTFEPGKTGYAILVRLIRQGSPLSGELRKCQMKLFSGNPPSHPPPPPQCFPLHPTDRSPSQSPPPFHRSPLQPTERCPSQYPPPPRRSPLHPADRSPSPQPPPVVVRSPPRRSTRLAFVVRPPPVVGSLSPLARPRRSTRENVSYAATTTPDRSRPRGRGRGRGASRNTAPSLSVPVLSPPPSPHSPHEVVTSFSPRLERSRGRGVSGSTASSPSIPASPLASFSPPSRRLEFHEAPSSSAHLPSSSSALPLPSPNIDNARLLLRQLFIETSAIIRDVVDDSIFEAERAGQLAFEHAIQRFDRKDCFDLACAAYTDRYMSSMRVTFLAVTKAFEKAKI